jgi:hypothetical protein
MRQLAIGGIALACAGAAAALVVLGRWEGERAEDEQIAGLRTVYAAAGPAVDSEALTAYRYRFEGFTCLLYRAGGNPVALELCYDTQGRLREAFDRRGDDLHVWSLRWDGEGAPVRVDPEAVASAVRRLRESYPWVASSGVCAASSACSHRRDVPSVGSRPSISCATAGLTRPGVTPGGGSASRCGGSRSSTS